jgi:hypothetical protein
MHSWADQRTSEQQYSHVLQQEVADMKALLPASTFHLSHRIRFFPKKGDCNGNPLPGTLVETGSGRDWLHSAVRERLVLTPP